MVNLYNEFPEHTVKLKSQKFVNFLFPSNSELKVNYLSESNFYLITSLQHTNTCMSIQVKEKWNLWYIHISLNILFGKHTKLNIQSQEKDKNPTCRYFTSTLKTLNQLSHHFCRYSIPISNIPEINLQIDTLHPKSRSEISISLREPTVFRFPAKTYGKQVGKVCRPITSPSSDTTSKLEREGWNYMVKTMFVFVPKEI